MDGTGLGIAGGLLEIGLGAVWYRLLEQVRIPADRRPILVAHAVGLALGVAAFALGTGTLGAVFAGIAILGAGSFLALAAQSRQAPRTPAVALGGPIVDFTLPDHESKPFDLATLRGRPFLLKFFRGHW
jgi:hypothetical protein